MFSFGLSAANNNRTTILSPNDIQKLISKLQESVNDPVFVGFYKDFLHLDNTLRGLHANVLAFMKGVDAFCVPFQTTTDMLLKECAKDAKIMSDLYMYREAINSVAVEALAHTSRGKMKKQLENKVLSPLVQHIDNNNKIKVQIEERGSRWQEFSSAKKSVEEMKKKVQGSTGSSGLASDPKYIKAESRMEQSKEMYDKLDRQVFDWLHILHKRKSDILRGPLISLQESQQEFFMSAAESFSSLLASHSTLPADATPEVLLSDIHLDREEERHTHTHTHTLSHTHTTNANGQETVLEGVTSDYTRKIFEKQDNDIVVNLLSLQALVQMGFEESKAKKALKLHDNNTQLAMDYMLKGALVDNGLGSSPSSGSADTNPNAAEFTSRSSRGSKTSFSAEDDSALISLSPPSELRSDPHQGSEDGDSTPRTAISFILKEYSPRKMPSEPVRPLAPPPNPISSVASVKAQQSPPMPSIRDHPAVPSTSLSCSAPGSAVGSASCSAASSAPGSVRQSPQLSPLSVPSPRSASLPGSVRESPHIQPLSTGASSRRSYSGSIHESPQLQPLSLSNSPPKISSLAESAGLLTHESTDDPDQSP